jgi:hypothetical protein
MLEKQQGLLRFLFVQRLETSGGFVMRVLDMADSLMRVRNGMRCRNVGRNFGHFDDYVASRHAYPKQHPRCALAKGMVATTRNAGVLQRQEEVPIS